MSQFSQLVVDTTSITDGLAEILTPRPVYSGNVFPPGGPFFPPGVSDSRWDGTRRRLYATWLADDYGNAQYTLPAIIGSLDMVTTYPLSPAMNNGYVLMLIDTFGNDALEAAGTARSNATPQTIVPKFGQAGTNLGFGRPVADALTVTITGGGGGKTGMVVLDYSRPVWRFGD